MSVLSKFMEGLWAYTITQPIKNRRFQVVATFLLVIWIILATMINIPAVGYEDVPSFSPSYNDTNVLWYEKFIPSRWRPQTRTCQPTIIELGDGFTSHTCQLTIGVVTNGTGFLQYTLIDYLNPNTAIPVNGMIYENTLLQNCSVVLAGVTQPASSPVEDKVILDDLARMLKFRRGLHAIHLRHKQSYYKNLDSN